MTGLSRCGKRYQLLGDAVTAADAKSFKSGRPWVATTCTRCNGWHVKDSTKNTSRPDPFPPAVAKLLDARDEHCQRCGSTGRLERHHRRAKASGGSGARAHTACLCNGVRLCRGCHRWAHEHPAAAREEGLIVRQSVALPGTVAMCPFSRQAIEQGQPVRVLYGTHWVFPTCEGGWTE